MTVRTGLFVWHLLDKTPKLYLLLSLNMTETPFSVVVYLFLNHFRKLNRRKNFLKSQLAEHFSAFDSCQGYNIGGLNGSKISSIQKWNVSIQFEFE